MPYRQEADYQYPILMEPIVLNEYGDSIILLNSSRVPIDSDEAEFMELDKFNQTYYKLHSSVVYLTHLICGGSIDYRKISSSHFSIYCRACYMRYCAPLRLKTFRHLRNHALKMRK